MAPLDHTSGILSRKIFQNHSLSVLVILVPHYHLHTTVLAALLFRINVSFPQLLGHGQGFQTLLDVPCAVQWQRPQQLTGESC